MKEISVRAVDLLHILDWTPGADLRGLPQCAPLPLFSQRQGA